MRLGTAMHIMSGFYVLFLSFPYRALLSNHNLNLQ